jgi:hypothetical protein
VKAFAKTGGGDMAQAIEHLPNKYEALEFKPQYRQKEKNKKPFEPESRCPCVAFAY